MDVTDRAAETTDQILEALKKGQQVALEAIRGFTEAVNEAMPGKDEDGRRQKIIESAFQMTDRLVEAQYEFVRRTVSASAKTLDTKKDASQ